MKSLFQRCLLQCSDLATIQELATLRFKSPSSYVSSPAMTHLKNYLIAGGIKISVILVLLLFSGRCFSQTKQPNIIYIMTDDMGYADLSGYGRKDYLTPHLDRLADQGMKFVNAYSAGPLCTPTRVGFMTGRYPAKIPVGLMEPLTPSRRDSAYGLTADIPSVAGLMKTNGYETVLIGKWHLGFLPEHSPVKNGFDYFFGIHSGAADYISHKSDGRRPDLYENERPVSVNGYLTDIFTQKVLDYLKKKHTKPFFLVLTYNAPHWPWQGPGDHPYPDTMNFRAGGSPSIYAAMMKSLDEGIGKVMAGLDKENLSDETLVIFTNDNGGERYSDNGGLAKSKSTLWEGGIRVPAFVRWPGKIAAGTTTDQVAITMDWTATILSAGGIKNTIELDGLDLMPVLTGQVKPIERTFFWRTFQRNKHKAVRKGDWKYLQDENGEYLFNLRLDKEEKMDLKGSNKETFEQLKNLMTEWEKTVLPPIPLK